MWTCDRGITRSLDLPSVEASQEQLTRRFQLARSDEANDFVGQNVQQVELKFDGTRNMQRHELKNLHRMQWALEH
jgi:hypothetical protein